LRVFRTASPELLAKTEVGAYCIMSNKINRRDLIINSAGNLFVQQGYAATSIRQIAEEVGVTEAALYYHFKEGKRELLRAVFESQMLDLMVGLDKCRDAVSLAELLQKYSYELKKSAPTWFSKVRWLISEFPNFNAEERGVLHQAFTALHKVLAGLIEPFVPEIAKANALAWIIICTLLGYGQLFWSLDIRSVVDIHLTELFEVLADTS
jgi:AcrR family transcriptional regulator